MNSKKQLLPDTEDQTRMSNLATLFKANGKDIRPRNFDITLLQNLFTIRSEQS